MKQTEQAALKFADEVRMKRWESIKPNMNQRIAAPLHYFSVHSPDFARDLACLLGLRPYEYLYVPLSDYDEYNVRKQLEGTGLRAIKLIGLFSAVEQHYLQHFIDGKWGKWGR